MPIGDRLQSLLRERGMKLSDLARETGISANTLYSYKRRNTLKVDPASLQKIADALEVDVRELMDLPVRPSEGEESEMTELLETLRRSPEMRTLFSISRKATPKEINQTIAILQALKGKEVE